MHDDRSRNRDEVETRVIPYSEPMVTIRGQRRTEDAPPDEERLYGESDPVVTLTAKSLPHPA